MENQFSAIHENPDIIVATPGRFLHVCVEMDLSLKNIKYVVFDEADRYTKQNQPNHVKNSLKNYRTII